MNFVDWGEINYSEAINRQMAMVESRAMSKVEDTCVFCSHPSVVTLGRASVEGDLSGWNGDVVECSRGGRATYHGPGQIVVYPIVDLNTESNKAFRKRDLHKYLETLEMTVIEALRSFSIDAVSGVQQAGGDKEKEYRGVWVGGKKIASIGIAVKKWITYHGVAINVYKDPLAFSGIQPCGFTAQQMTSVEDILGRKVDKNELIAEIKDKFKEFFI